MAVCTDLALNSDAVGEGSVADFVETRVQHLEPGCRHAQGLAKALVATLAIPDAYVQRWELVWVVLTEKERERVDGQ